MFHSFGRYPSPVVSSSGFFVTYAKVVERVMSLGWLCLKVLVRNKQICEENAMGLSENSVPLNPIGGIPHFQSHPNVTKKG